MESIGYRLYDLHEHAFRRDAVSAAFASLESLADFAGVDISRIPVITGEHASYLLLELADYLNVYTASSTDGYRADKKNKSDSAKILLIRQALENREFTKQERIT